jgi:hypothetical protein
MSNPLILIYKIPTTIEITLPIYNYTGLYVIWDSEKGTINTKKYLFKTPGIKVIRIYGNIQTLSCGDSELSDKYITQCSDFGDVGLTKISFKHAVQLQKLPLTLPSTVTDLSELCANTSFDDNISSWDTSCVTNFNYCFKDNFNYNQPVWTSVPLNLCTRTGMFENAFNFNQDISLMSVSNTVNMDKAFKHTNISIEDFTNAYNTWATQSNLVPCIFKNNTLIYTLDAEEARQTLQQNGWKIEDDIAILNARDTNKPILLKYNHGPWANEYIHSVIKIQNSSQVITQTTENLLFHLIFQKAGQFKIPVQLNTLPINTININIVELRSFTREAVNTPVGKMNMGSLFTNNAQVYYKPHSLAPGGIGGVRNYRKKSRKT